MRINKFFSNMGYCSRKETNRLIKENRVTVNGKLCIPGQWVEETDIILVDNKPLESKNKVYILLNKPVGIVCTSAKEIESNIVSYMGYPEYIFPVGRLDKESQGLILMTNDGELANKILNSDNEHEKEYMVTLDKSFDDSFVEGMSAGVEVLNIKTRPCKVTRVSDDTFRIILTQGLNRQIRRMSKAFGYNVEILERVRIMNLKIDGIEMGKWRHLTKIEENELKKELSL
ncbi:pseudouridine synthase [Clostridium intestinale]|uniref:Pseudouridine synthase n=1 Tax=Clostridium intestinale DSM 6191 TaxID=1121320 RepID=A0A1M5VVB8_9CLOT|nr:pseudouridine synthase [Clostridium intestinale]SHH79130.1 23S rRNA pseudouridine2604 synthase [Clostridium intestinale DSM 6191]